ncbi:hydrogenase maturation protease [Candidatus Woesearchaeota archaeon]|nr:hydrogenase maturation protease [Candidatus Woesearchaeota archaeon]
MKRKVFFIGNPLGGDDGIGPYLFKELKKHPKLKGFDMLELGVIGLDLISYVEDDDRLIIVDAVHSEKDIGKVVVLKEEDLLKKPLVVSQHDFGIEETMEVLRMFKPGLKAVNIIGINVKRIRAFADKLSDEIMKKMPEIKEEVIERIIEASR